MDKHWKADIISGFEIFLIALPLSIGIALAAGTPASAGILAAIIGGIVGTLITGTHIAITGPAAGLIVVVSSSIITLGNGDLLLGFKRTLAATIVVGVLQILVGLFKLGKLTFLAPAAVVHGMLSAIGLIIMIKQIPVLLGVVPKSKSITSLLVEIPELLINNNLVILSIGLISFSFLLLAKLLPKKISAFLPAPLIAVLAGLIFSVFLNIKSSPNISFLNNNYLLGPEFLVKTPKSLLELFIFPVFDVIFSINSLISITTLFLIGTLESLLSSYAVDKLDPYKRKTDFDYDIIGKGVTNIFCGALGGYPIITEIVRSSANISNGAKTKWSNFFHGVFILIFVGFFPSFINLIPLTSLAAILIFIGFNLAHPNKFIEMWKHGKDQFFLFSLTLIITIVEDLLIGVIVGIIAKIILHLFRRVKIKEFFSPDLLIEKNADQVYLNINSNVVFLGYIKVKNIIEGTDTTKVIIINKSNFYIDHTITELLHDRFEEIEFE